MPICNKCNIWVSEDNLICPYCGNMMDSDEPKEPEDSGEGGSLAEQARKPDQEELQQIRKRNKIILIAVAALILFSGIVTAIFFLVKSINNRPPSDSSSDVPSSVDDQLLTVDEAQTYIENYFHCNAVKTDEILNSIIFDCYGIEDNQYMGTVQIDRSTTDISIIKWSDNTSDNPDDSVLDESADESADETESTEEPQVTADATESTEEPQMTAAEAAPTVSAAVTVTPENNTVVKTKYVSNLDYGLYLWKDTQCKEHYCTVYLGEAVGFIANAGNTYAKVSYNGNIGYINSKYLSDQKPTIDTSVKRDMYAAYAGVALYDGPSENYNILYTLSKNEKVGYVSEMTNHEKFIKVKYNDVICYAAKGTLSDTIDNVTVVSYKYVDHVDYAVNLYSNSDGTVPLKMVLLGEQVGFIQNVSGTKYAKVSYGGTIGYINTNYLSDQKPEIDTEVKKTMYVISDNTPLREAPTDAGTVRVNLSAGTEVGYIMTMQSATKYAKVRYNGSIAYILYSALSDSMPQTSEDTSSKSDSGDADISISGSSASSTLPRDKFSYETENAYDNNLETAWVEGVDGDGIGEYLCLNVAAGTTITELMIMPGYCKSETLFYKNGCPTELEISSGGTSVTVYLSEAADSWSVSRSGVNFQLSTPITSDGTVRITIRGVRTGNTYQDTSISEIRLSGN